MNELIKNGVDVDLLNKGDYIESDFFEKLFGLPKDNIQYPLALLRIKGQIEKHFEERGTPVTIRMENYGIRILTDSEATIYNNQRFKQALSHAHQSHYKQQTVDTRNLNETEKGEHKQRVVNQSKFLQAINKVRMEIEYQGHERVLPKSITMGEVDEELEENEEVREI